MIAQMSEGFLLGIATGTTCLATCGPIYAPYLMLSGGNLRASLLTLLEISGGRFVTYLLIGLVAGLLGRQIGDIGDRTWFTAIAYLAFSLYLIFTVFRTKKRSECCRTSRWQAFARRPFILGLLTGINFCPSFLLAFTKAVDLSGPVAGMSLFGAFFVGTSIFLLPLSIFGLFGSQFAFRRVAQVCAVGVAAWFIGQGVWIIRGQLDTGLPAAAENIINVMDSTSAFIITDDPTQQGTLQKILASKRKGSVTALSPVSALPEAGYFFTYTSTDDTATHTHHHPLRKAGRFVILLPGRLQYSTDEKTAGRIAAFLAEYSFKIDPDSGSVYRLPPGVTN
jgi:sulfite exporter TauE/SafE